MGPGVGTGDGGKWGCILGKDAAGGTCRPEEAVGWKTLQMYSKCSEGELPGPQFTLSGPTLADRQINSYHQLSSWVSGAAVAAWAALIYHPSPKQIKSPRVI